MRIKRGLHQSNECPPRHGVHRNENPQHTDDNSNLEPGIGHGGEHRTNVWHVSEIPEQVNVTTVERPGGNVGVASDHENDPERRQPTQGPAKSRFSPAPRQDRRERDAGQLDREIPGQSDAECRPDVTEGQRQVQEHQSAGEAYPAPTRHVLLLNETLNGSPVPPAASANNPPSTGSPYPLVK